MSSSSSLKFKTAPQLLQLIDDYFIHIKGEYEYQQVKSSPGAAKLKTWIREPEPPTLSNLALYLGFNSMDQFKQYEKRAGLIKPFRYAKLRVEAAYEQQLFEKPTGAIFALKNAGWNDKPGTKHTGATKTLKVEITNTGPVPAGNEKEVDVLI